MFAWYTGLSLFRYNSSTLACIDAVTLVPGFQQGILARIAGQHSGDVRLEQVVQPGSPGSFFKGHVQTAAQAANKLEDRLAFVSTMASITRFRANPETATEIVA